MKRRTLVLAALALVVGTVVTTGTNAAPAKTRGLLVTSALALDRANETVTLPLFKGRTPSGKALWYVITDDSSKADARKRGVNFAPRLEQALGTAAVQRVTKSGDELVFKGTVDFSPKHVVVPSKDGFPPAKVAPGARGDSRYSPFVTAGDGIVLNASQVMNSTGTNDSVVAISTAKGWVKLKLLRGFFKGSSVLYLRLDGSIPLLAGIEASTYAPKLNALPGIGSDAAGSARSPIIPVVNGELGKSNKLRQGLQSALLGQGDPLNVTDSLPGTADYTPAWDVTPAVWSPGAVESGKRVVIRSTDQVAKLARAGLLVSAGKEKANDGLGGLRALGAVSNCPTIAFG